MNRVPRPQRLPRALLAVLVTAVLALLALPVGGLTAPAQADETEVGGVAEEVQAVFVGTFVGNPLVFSASPERTIRVYRVEVDQVFGEVDVATQRVKVRSRADLLACAADSGSVGGSSTDDPSPSPTPGQPSTPSGPDTPATTEQTEPVSDRAPRVFTARFDTETGVYAVVGCSQVQVASETLERELVDEYGEGRPAGVPQPPAEPEFDDVTYRCEDSDATVRDVDSPECDAAAARTPFGRPAAPGLALVIVGVLGLLLARRLGRTR